MKFRFNFKGWKDFATRWQVTRLAAAGMLTFLAWHIIDVLKAAMRVKYEDIELIIALVAACIAAVAYVAKGDKEPGD